MTDLAKMIRERLTAGDECGAALLATANLETILAALESTPSRALVEALHRIGYEPYGRADASHAEVLEAITQDARDTLAKHAARLATDAAKERA